MQFGVALEKHEDAGRVISIVGNEADARRLAMRRGGQLVHRSVSQWSDFVPAAS